MSINLLIMPKFFAWNDKGGKPLAFGKVFVYEVGTNIPKTSYTGINGKAENTNPVILDENGFADIYIESTAKIIVKDKNDVELYSFDEIGLSDKDVFDEEYKGKKLKNIIDDLYLKDNKNIREIKLLNNKMIQLDGDISKNLETTFQLDRVNKDNIQSLLNRQTNTDEKIKYIQKLFIAKGDIIGVITYANLKENKTALIGLVVNDPDKSKNGFYARLTVDDDWEQAQFDDISNLENKIDAVENIAENNTNNIKELSKKILPNLLKVADIEPFILAIVDEANNIGISMKHNSDIQLPTFEIINSDDGLSVGYTIADSAMRGLFTVTSSGIVKYAGVTNYQTTKKGQYSIVDEYSNIVLDILDNGVVNIPNGISSDNGTCYIENGRVIHQKGAVIKKLPMFNYTAINCYMNGQAINYVATRKGIPIMYKYDKGETKQIHYTNDNYIDGYLLTGQSLAVGSAPVISNVNKSNALSFDKYTMIRKKTEKNTGITRLVERDNRETICSGFANANTQDKKIFIWGGGVSGAKYDWIKKGATYGIYERNIEQVEQAQHFAMKPIYRALFLVHGESDGMNSYDNYDIAMSDLLASYNADIKAITGQQDDLVMLACQVNSSAFQNTLENRHAYKTTFAQLKASIDNPRIFLVTPKYHFDYKDGLHINSQSTIYLGEYYAKVKKIVIDKGGNWVGTSPMKLNKLNSKQFIIRFYVPVKPLVFDTDRVTKAENFGFVIYKKGIEHENIAQAKITNVEIIGDDLIKITTDIDIEDGSTVTYAFDVGEKGNEIRKVGARGNLRDSDPLKSLDGKFNMHNWAFAFELEIK